MKKAAIYISSNHIFVCCICVIAISSEVGNKIEYGTE